MEFTSFLMFKHPSRWREQFEGKSARAVIFAAIILITRTAIFLAVETSFLLRGQGPQKAWAQLREPFCRTFRLPLTFVTHFASRFFFPFQQAYP